MPWRGAAAWRRRLVGGQWPRAWESAPQSLGVGPLIDGDFVWIMDELDVISWPPLSRERVSPARPSSRWPARRPWGTVGWCYVTCALTATRGGCQRPGIITGPARSVRSSAAVPHTAASALRPFDSPCRMPGKAEERRQKVRAGAGWASPMRIPRRGGGPPVRSEFKKILAAESGVSIVAKLASGKAKRGAGRGTRRLRASLAHIDTLHGSTSAHTAPEAPSDSPGEATHRACWRVRLTPYLSTYEPADIIRRLRGVGR